MSENCKKCGKAPQATPEPRLRCDKNGYAPPCWNRPKNKKVYGIRETGTEQFVYVGQTTDSLGNRLFGHRHPNNPSSTLKAWFAELELRGVNPEIVLLQELNYGCDQIVHEMLWIKRLKREKHKLLNRVTYANGCRLADKRQERLAWKANLFATATLYTGPMWLDGDGKFPNRRTKKRIAAEALSNATTISGAVGQQAEC